MPAQPIVVGGTYDWFLNPAMINTEASPSVYGLWDITGATVTISFLRYANGTEALPTAASHFSATVISGTAGTARYINLTTLFTVTGDWGVSWKVSVGGTVLETDVFFFKVKLSGAAQ